MNYIGRNANGFNQVSQSALAVTVNGIDQALYTTSSYFYSGSTIITGSVFISGSLSVSGTLSNLKAGPPNTIQTITSPSTTWVVDHNYDQRYVIVQAFDYEWKQIIPKSIELTSVNRVTLTFDTAESGYIIISVGGGSFRYDNFYINDQNVTDKLATTGSNIFVGNQTITGSTLITGSLTVNGSTTITGSLTVLGSSTNIGTAISTVGTNTTITGSLLITGSQTNIGNTTITGSLILSGSSHTISGSLNALTITGSLLGTSSWANNVISASYISGSVFTSTNPATSASYALSSSNSLFATSASYASSSTSASYAFTSSYITGSSFTSTNPALSASYAATASLLLGSVGNATTASYIAPSFFTGSNAAFSSSFSTTSSFANNASQLNNQPPSFYQTASNINAGTFDNARLPSAISVTSVTASFTGSLTGSLWGTASWANNSISASYITGSIFTSTNPALTSSYALTSSFLIGNISSSDVSYYAYTASFADRVTTGYVRSLISGDTRISFTSQSAFGDVTMQINVSSSNFSQNGQILALATGMANIF